jgi:hypothetical protein
LGFTGIYERFLAPQAGFSVNSKGRAAAEADRARRRAAGREQVHTFQQWPKLVGTGAAGSTNQGMSVALSADGNTAIVGGPGPNNADRDRSPFVGPAGAAWVFTRSGGGWRQQGGKLVGATSEYGGGLWSQGASVALSADGNTAIVGGPSDNGTTGAAWVFTRRGDVWMQQSNKLVGSGAGEPPLPPGQGMSVALSADGNTAIVGSWGAWRCLDATRQEARRQRCCGRGPPRHVRRPFRRREYRHRGRVVRQQQDRGGMGVHPQWRCLDTARQEARRHRRRGKRPPRHVRRAIRRWQYRHRGWAWRQAVGSIGALRARGGRGGVGVHPQWWCLDAGGQ